MTNASASPASQDTLTIALLNIDNQRSFVEPNGSLYVKGADLSAVRAASFVKKNIRRITKIYSTRDMHGEIHIFYAIWWKNAKGEHPTPFTEFTDEDVLKGLWIPVFQDNWSLEYIKKLKKITIWPVHCTAGTEECEIVPVLLKEIEKHSELRLTEHIQILKGVNSRTDHFGAFGAEVIDPEDSGTFLNEHNMEELSIYDLVYVIGQERNHCVRRTLDQYIAYCRIHKPEAISKIRYVVDCIDLHPLGAEYYQDAEQSLQSMIDQGVVLVKSTDPIPN